MDKDFKDFLICLFAKMSTGDFTVKVECAENKLFDADVIGYSVEYMTINVRFHSDDLTKPGVKQVPVAWGFGSEPEYTLEHVQIPVKCENVYYKSIKI